MIRGIDKWLPGYLASLLRRPRPGRRPRHLVFCVADHFEPFRRTIGADGVARGGRTADEARQLVAEWAERYHAFAGHLRDSDGRPPRHTFFYPQEEYDPGCLDLLAGLAAEGLAEVEIHLHHRNDTAEGLRQKLAAFRDTLRREHGLLGAWSVERGAWGGNDRTPTTGAGTSREISLHAPCSMLQAATAYGFVHGNWALCNSRPDGDWCGVNEELGILAETGCYADFTFPSAPSPTQPRTVNAIYRAWDRPGRARGHDGGVACRVGGGRWEVGGGRWEVGGGRWKGEGGKGVAGGGRGKEQDGEGEPVLAASAIHGPESMIQNRTSGLLLIQGPLGLDWRRRKWGVLPRLDAGGIATASPPAARRADLWVRQGIHVRGRPEWVFVKAHTHGVAKDNSAVLLGAPMLELHRHLQTAFNDGDGWRLHYVTAREMYNIVRAAEEGAAGDPGEFRDYEVGPPPAASPARRNAPGGARR